LRHNYYLTIKFAFSFLFIQAMQWRSTLNTMVSEKIQQKIIFGIFSFTLNEKTLLELVFCHSGSSAVDFHFARHKIVIRHVYAYIQCFTDSHSRLFLSIKTRQRAFFIFSLTLTSIFAALLENKFYQCSNDNSWWKRAKMLFENILKSHKTFFWFS
jgi:hypothetical protein